MAYVCGVCFVVLMKTCFVLLFFAFVRLCLLLHSNVLHLHEQEYVCLAFNACAVTVGPDYLINGVTQFSPGVVVYVLSHFVK